MATRPLVRRTRVSEAKKTVRTKAPKMLEITLKKSYLINGKVYPKDTTLLVEDAGIYQDFGGHDYTTEFSDMYSKKSLRKALAADEDDTKEDATEKKELRRLMKKFNILPGDPAELPAKEVGQDALDQLAEDDEFEYEGSPEDEFEDMEAQEDLEEEDNEEERVMLRRKPFAHKYLRKPVKKDDDDLEEEDEDEDEEDKGKKALRRPLRRFVKKDDKELDEEDDEEDDEEKEDKKDEKKTLRRAIRRPVKKDEDEDLEEEEDEDETEKKALRRPLRRPMRHFARRYNVVPDEVGQEAMDRVQESTRTRRNPAPRQY